MIRLSSLGRTMAHLAIRTYQLTFSSLVGSYCRHLPTCSAYMDEAIGRHGLWTGGVLGLKRVCRCHPWGTSGYDPVPEALPAKDRGSSPADRGFDEKE